MFGSERVLDAVLSAADPARLHTHLLVERWTLDEFALPRRLVVDLATHIVREDRFIRGTLEIGGRCAAPSPIRARRTISHRRRSTMCCARPGSTI